MKYELKLLRKNLAFLTAHNAPLAVWIQCWNAVLELELKLKLARLPKPKQT